MLVLGEDLLVEPNPRKQAGMAVAFCQMHFFYKYGRCNRLNTGISLWAGLEGGLEAAAEESEEKLLKACRWVQIANIT